MSRAPGPRIPHNLSILLVVVFFVLLLSVFTLYTSYHSTQEAAFDKVVVSAQSYSEHLNGLFMAVDIALGAIVRHALVEAGAPQQATATREEMEYQLLFVPQIEQFEYYDSQQRVARVPEVAGYGDVHIPAELISLHRDAWVESAVTISQETGQILVSRSVVREGIYAGVVVARLPSAFLYDITPGLLFTGLAHVALFDTNGTLLSHWGEVDQLQLPPRIEFLHNPARGPVLVATSRFYIGGETRLNTLPLRLSLFFDRDLLMIGWERQLDYSIAILALFAAAAFVASLGVRRLRRRQEEVKNQLLQEQESHRITELLGRVRAEALAADSEHEIIRASASELVAFLDAQEIHIHSFGDNEAPPTDIVIRPNRGKGDTTNRTVKTYPFELPIRVGQRPIGEVAFTLLEETKGWHRRVAEQALTVMGGSLLRFRIESRLRDTEARLAAFMNTSPSINYLCDGSGSVVYANPAFRRAFGDRRRLEPHLHGEATETDVLKQHVQVEGEDRIFSTRIFSFTDSAGDTLTGGVGIDITDMEHTQHRLKKALEDRELLLREIHHRVKNNLAVIDSLLAFEQQKIPPRPSEELIAGIRSRVQAIALIHKRLYRADDLSRIDFREYCEELVDYIFQTVAPLSTGAANLHMDIEDIELDIAIVKPLGLILHELVSNSVKYAHVEGKAARMDISFRRNSKGYFALEVRDYGPGFEAEPKMDPESSLGYFVINALCAELNGRLETWNDNGAHARVVLSSLTSRTTLKTS